MSVKANILRDAQGNIIVQMQGDLDYASSMPLRQHLEGLTEENPHSKITLDLGGMDFVGSSGICHFVETIQLLNNRSKHGKRMAIDNCHDDFRKVFRLYTQDESELFWDEFDMDNDVTKNMNTQFGNRKRTFEN